MKTSRPSSHFNRALKSGLTTVFFPVDSRFIRGSNDDDYVTLIYFLPMFPF